MYSYSTTILITQKKGLTQNKWPNCEAGSDLPFTVRVRIYVTAICGPAPGFVKVKFRYAILVADRSAAGRRPAASWNLAYHLAR